jgi:hypothetical protein
VSGGCAAGARSDRAAAAAVAVTRKLVPDANHLVSEQEERRREGHHVGGIGTRAPLPRRHGDWARPSHICSRTGLARPCRICDRTGLAHAHIGAWDSPGLRPVCGMRVPWGTLPQAQTAPSVSSALSPSKHGVHVATCFVALQRAVRSAASVGCDTLHCAALRCNRRDTLRCAAFALHPARHVALRCNRSARPAQPSRRRRSRRRRESARAVVR